MSNKAEVFTVEDGEYSDYGILGVYSTRALAEEALKRLKDRYNNPWIQERTLDVMPETPLGKYGFGVEMRRDGTCDVYSCPVPDKCRDHFFDGNLICQLWAKSKEHAVKIVSERRRRFIAEGKWPETGDYKAI